MATPFGGDKYELAGHARLRRVPRAGDDQQHTLRDYCYGHVLKTLKTHVVAHSPQHIRSRRAKGRLHGKPSVFRERRRDLSRWIGPNMLFRLECYASSAPVDV